MPRTRPRREGGRSPAELNIVQDVLKDAATLLRKHDHVNMFRLNTARIRRN
ncbi:hypothetical protein [Streptomyces sp. NPDC088350]|uniref:hypothetical protein n=1 Tax=Streptomyces sp. NPDC088350 TaxID=3365854 RepID=UPI003827CBAA